MEFFDSYEKGLIVHHWDTDGICSAAMLLKSLGGKGIDNVSPTLGNYYLTEDEIDSIKEKGYEFIAIVDVCIPRENVLKIKEATGAEVFIFDHHLQEKIEEVEHFNPLSEGASSERFPSATWVLSQWLGIDLHVVLGAVGDKESKIKDNERVYDKIVNLLRSENMEFDQLLRMVELIDSNYKVMEKDQVEKAARFMARDVSAEGILNYQLWNQNALRVRKEIQRQMSNELREEGNTLLLNIVTPLNIISTITRRLARSNPGKTVIVANRGFFWDRNQIYVRGNDVMHVIGLAKERGYSAGGKREVAGIVLPNADTNDFLEVIKENV